MKNDLTRATIQTPEFRVLRTENSLPTLRGYAAVFDQKIDFGLFSESVAPGAFRTSIENKDDVRALFNHDPNYVLARTTNGTLKLEEDSHGLLTHITPPDIGWARDLLVSIERGDINQMSFGFIIEKEEMIRSEGEKVHFKITQARLFDVSPVTYPAYPTTEVEVQRHKELRVKQIAGEAEAELELRNRKLRLFKAYLR